MKIQKYDLIIASLVQLHEITCLDENCICKNREKATQALTKKYSNMNI